MWSQRHLSEGLSAALSGEAVPEPGKAKVTCFGTHPVPESALSAPGTGQIELAECDFQGIMEELVPRPEDVRLANLLGAFSLADHLRSSVEETKLSAGALAAIVLAQELITVQETLRMPVGDDKVAALNEYLSYMGFSLPQEAHVAQSRIIQV
jgi:hypothetical protein